jgi:ubiquinone/menaquinone biosynthesis C-methylase UbiE
MLASVSTPSQERWASLEKSIHHLLQGDENQERFAQIKKMLLPLSQFQKTPENPHEAYCRNVLISNGQFEVMIASWKKNMDCLPHDHGFSKGRVVILEGTFVETNYKWVGTNLEADGALLTYNENDVVHIDSNDVHSMHCLDEGGLTLHIYTPPIQKMKVYSLEEKLTYTVSDNCGAWIPKDDRQVLSKTNWDGTTPFKIKPACDLILYTTLYRGGGDKFERAARTKEKELKRESTARVLSVKIASKKDFLRAFATLQAEGYQVRDFHFFGHSGMYGIMFGTVEWPEQFSPYEWKNMNLPLAPQANFYFHACRSGRWFAPFIARTLGVKAYGYHNYTSVSLSPNKFIWDKYKPNSEDVYIIACAGKKSHGLLGSAKKYSHFCAADKMSEYLPSSEEIDTTYDQVADLYEETFQDIKVRSDELDWLNQQMSKVQPKAVLDIGCGNGAFLHKLSGFFETGMGCDLSQGMIDQARLRRADNKKLSFTKIDGPHLPFPDNSFDVVMSTLSFRYLDWDPCMQEILRVLKPGGRFLVIDMVAAPVRYSESFLFVKSKIKQVVQGFQIPSFKKALQKLVTSNAWKKMLHYNPIRSEHEMKWYLESRFKGQKVELLNVGWNSRIIAFDTGPVQTKTIEKLSFP